MRADQSEEFGIFLAHDELREAQGEMIVDGIAALGAGGFLLASAPTGIGKTAAALAAALDASRKSPESKVVMFLTGRQSQHRIVVDTVRRINRNLVVLSCLFSHSFLSLSLCKLQFIRSSLYILLTLIVVIG